MLIKDTNSGTRKINGQATSGRVIRDLLASEDSTIVLPMPPVMFVTSPAGSATIKDAMISWPETTLTTTDVHVTVPSGGYSTGPVTYASSNTGVATIDSSGNVTPVSAGTTLITVTIPGLNNRLVMLNVVQAGGPTEAVPDGIVSGSLGAHLVAQVTALIGTQMPPPGLPSVDPPPAFSLLNIYNIPSGTRNSGVWTGSLDLTCIPQSGEGILLAPDIVAFAAHVGTPPSSITFVDNSSVTNVASVLSPYYDLSSPSGDGADIRIARLGSSMPSSITPVNLMPYNFRSYLPQPQYGYPVLFTNQDKTLLIADNTGYFRPGGVPSAMVTQSVDSVRKNWWYEIRVGDSGNPIFQVINGALVLVSLWHFKVPDSGPIYADNISQIDAAITAVGSTSTVATASLSGFTTY